MESSSSPGVDRARPRLQGLQARVADRQHHESARGVRVVSTDTDRDHWHAGLNALVSASGASAASASSGADQTKRTWSHASGAGSCSDSTRIIDGDPTWNHHGDGVPSQVGSVAADLACRHYVGSPPFPPPLGMLSVERVEALSGSFGHRSTLSTLSRSHFAREGLCPAASLAVPVGASGANLNSKAPALANSSTSGGQGARAGGEGDSDGDGTATTSNTTYSSVELSRLLQAFRANSALK